MKSDFQAGVDKIYNACVEAGSTPTEKTPSACVDAIDELHQSIIASIKRYYILGTSDGKISDMTDLSESEYSSIVANENIFVVITGKFTASGYAGSACPSNWYSATFNPSITYDSSTSKFSATRISGTASGNDCHCSFSMVWNTYYVRNPIALNGTSGKLSDYVTLKDYSTVSASDFIIVPTAIAMSGYAGSACPSNWYSNSCTPTLTYDADTSAYSVTGLTCYASGDDTHCNTTITCKIYYMAYQK